MNYLSAFLTFGLAMMALHLLISRSFSIFFV